MACLWTCCLLALAFLPEAASSADDDTASFVTAVRQAAHAHPGLDGVALLDTGADALAARDALISTAQRTLDAQYYIWNADASGRYVAARLIEAAERGVQVRILLDDINSAGRDAVLLGLAFHPRIDVRIYNPTKRRGGPGRLLEFATDFKRINRRMHNKSFTVDGVATVVGGRNIGNEYFDLDPELNFRDRELLLAGPVVDGITAGFEAFWQSPLTMPIEGIAPAAGDAAAESSAAPTSALAAALPDVEALGYVRAPDLDTAAARRMLTGFRWAPVRVVVDPPPPAGAVGDSSRQQPVALALRAFVASASDEVLAESAYLIPGAESLADMERLHSLGVRVGMLTNSLASNDLVTNHSGYARHRKKMLDRGIELYELRPDAAACLQLVIGSKACESGPAFSLHSKSIVIDRKRVYVGSMNLNLRSAYLNSETAIIVDSPELATTIARSIEALMRPDSSWRVQSTPGGRLEWIGERAGQPVVLHREPMAGTWRRFQSRIYRMFPVEKYL